MSYPKLRTSRTVIDYLEAKIKTPSTSIAKPTFGDHEPHEKQPSTTTTAKASDKLPNNAMKLLEKKRLVLVVWGREGCGGDGGKEREREITREGEKPLPCNHHIKV